METPIEVLRIEQSGISKELGRFRACDTETRSLYCREWAQYIYKKHFVWNAKTQEDVFGGSDQNGSNGSNAVTTVQAGKYQINFLTTVHHHHHHCDCDDHEEDEEEEHDDAVKKERSCLLGKKFEDLAASWTSADSMSPDRHSLLSQITTACQLWMTLPSGYTGLPDCFEPVEFNPYPDAIPLVDDAKDPSQLLDPLIIERQALCLPSDCFHLLKNLTGDILLSHTTPTCNHSKPNSKTPADLEVDRAIFNEHEQTAVTQALKELSLALEVTWYPLNQFLKQLGDLEKRRAHLMGKGCQTNIDQFFTNQKYVSFVDHWTNTEAAQFKNKKSTEEEIAKVDGLFESHLDSLKSLVNQFMSEFVPKVLEDIHVLTNDLWKMVVPTIYELGERMAKREASKGSENAAKIGESLKSLDVDYLKKMESTKEVDSAKKRITAALNTKVEEYVTEIDALLKLYKESTRPNLSARLEKLNSKEFRKKIKKVESGYYSIRQTFRYEVTEKIFPESLFCKFALVCLEPLLQEGEMVEALTIEKEVKRFLEAYKDLWQQRSTLLHRFEQGVQTGRRELAGVLGKLFLKEGMRIQGDNLALKRQNSLLKSMGVDVDNTAASKSKKKKSAGGSSTPAQQPESISTTPSPTVTTASAKKLTTANTTPDKKSASPVPPVKSIEAPAAASSADKSKVVKTVTPPTKPASPVKVLKIVSSPKVAESLPTVTVESTPSVKSPSPLPLKPVTPTPVNKPATASAVAKAPVKAATPPPVKTPSPAPPAVKVEPKKPVIAEVKKVEEEPKKPAPFVYEELRAPPKPKVRSGKIPAPAPIIEKVEPKVTVSTKNKSAPVEKSKKKKEEQVVPAVKDEVATAVKAEVVAHVPVKAKEEPVANNDVQDWETIRASVATSTESNNVEPQQNWNNIVKSVNKEDVIVQDWNNIRAQVVQQEEDKKLAAAAGKAETAAPVVELGGWSTVAKKAPVTVETNWSTTAEAASDWNIPIKKVASPALSTASSAAWSTTATAGNGWDTAAASPAISNAEKSASGSGWGVPADSPVVAAEKPVVAAPPGSGWGVPASPVILEKPAVAAPPGSGWGVPAASPVVTSEKSTTISAPPGWGAPAGSEKTTSAPPGWGAAAAEKPAVSSPPGWSDAAVIEANSTSLGGWGQPAISATWPEKKKSTHKSTISSSSAATPNWNTTATATKDAAAPPGGGWNSNQLPWNDEPTTPVQAPVAPKPVINTEVIRTMPPPSTSTPVSANKPPGLSLAPAVVEQKPSSLLNSVTAPAGLAPASLSTTSTLVQHQQYNEPLPANLHEMAPEMLILITNNLHRENGSLIQTVQAVQQEMSMMTSRYAEIMALAREREAQNLQLFESRKQTEMEDVKRYVLSLEARIKQLEQPAATAGFGNQDLFAGYREEMRSSPTTANTGAANHHQGQHHQGQGQQRYNNNGGNRKMWQKNNHIIRCGNCGEMGHESAECKTSCRYCGSSEHLSEACPMN